MNPMFLAFALFVLWTTVAIVFLLLGPLFVPNLLPENLKNRLLGYGAAMLAVWNLVRFRWTTRAYRKQLEMDEAYRQLTNPPRSADDETKLIVHPEFKFDDEKSRPHAD